MSLIAEFTICSPRLALQPTLRAVPGVTVELEGQLVTSHQHPMLVVWVTGEDIATFEASLDDDPTVERMTILERLERTRLYRIKIASTVQRVYSTYQRLGAAPLAATATFEGWKRRVRFPDRDALAAFREFCEKSNISFQLHRLYRPSVGGESDLGLTDGQRQALQMAFHEGYFEVPRQADLAALGDSLGVSAQSVSERLRRGIRQLLAETLCEENQER